MSEIKNPTITIGNNEYELIFTLNAAKEIIGRFGDIENLPETLYDNKEGMDKLFDDMIWLIMVLANQAILQYNFYHKEEKKELLTEEEVKLFCSPAQFLSLRDSIIQAVVAGMNRNVPGNEDIKNQDGE